MSGWDQEAISLLSRESDSHVSQIQSALGAAHSGKPSAYRLPFQESNAPAALVKGSFKKDENLRW